MKRITSAYNTQTNSGRLFFVVSGEHESLPAAEIRGILESSNQHCSGYEEHYRLVSLIAPATALRFVAERSLMYDQCGLELGRCVAEEAEIFSLIQSLPLDDIAENSENFAVRSARLGGVSKWLSRTKLDQSVGSIIKRKIPRLAVRLKEPHLTFLCLIYENSFIFGILAYTKPPGMIAPRRPRKRPVFHPATMPPKIARCIVNLARAQPHTIFGDPFSGVGGIMIEAAMIGCEVVGVDASPRMIKGARRNLRHFQLSGLGYILGDARSLPIHGLAAIATDPPYGRDSSTRGVRVNRLYRDYLEESRDALNRGSHMCISAPSQVDVESYANDAGLRVREKHLARIHRSLTRQFVVIQNP